MLDCRLFMVHACFSVTANTGKEGEATSLETRAEGSRSAW